MVNTPKRKAEHLKIISNSNVNFDQKTTGFENYQFIHNSLPEINFDDIDISEEFLGYKLSFPFLINSMTGGEKNGEELNRVLSKIANDEEIAFALGSIRPCLENSKTIKSYAITRQIAPDTPILGNIGAAQLLTYPAEIIRNVLNEIDVNGLCIHLNPLQEVLQPEGDKNFSGVTGKIKTLAEYLDIPIIIKEVGFGLPIQNIQDLKSFGIKWFDVSGAGGTSWAKVERHRNDNLINKKVAEEFAEFGLPTAEIISQAINIKDINLIASGGINSGITFAKAIAMGARLGGVAGALIQSWNKDGVSGIQNLIKIYKKTLKICLLITGKEKLDDFRNTTLKKIK